MSWKIQKHTFILWQTHSISVDILYNMVSFFTNIHANQGESILGIQRENEPSEYANEGAFQTSVVYLTGVALWNDMSSSSSMTIFYE